jgi:hypothetical protein
MLTYTKSNNLEVIGYSDADFAGCCDSRRSILEYVFTCTNGAILWKSFKQTLTTYSMMKDEFGTCYEVVRQSMSLKNIIPGLSGKQYI